MALFPLPDTWAAVLAITWLVLSIPVSILVALDWFRTAPADTTGSRLVRHALRVPVFLLGAVSMLIGLAVLGWVAYNLLWERQPQFQWGGSIGLMVLMVGFGWYLARLAWSREPRSSDPPGGGGD